MKLDRRAILAIIASIVILITYIIILILIKGLETMEFIYWSLFVGLIIGELLVVHVFKLPKTNKIRDWVEPAFEAIIIATIIRIFIIQAFKIPTSSMEDTLLINDHIIATKFSYGTTIYYPEIKNGKISFKSKKILRFQTPKRGDVVIFRYPVDPKLMFIKRCIGLPGDTIEIKDKVVYVNSKKLDEKYVYHKDFRVFPASFAPRDNYGPVKVPEGHYFVMGDNRDYSSDSRFWGFLPDDYLKGKAWLVYWPPTRWRFIKHEKINIEDKIIDVKGTTVQTISK